MTAKHVLPRGLVGSIGGAGDHSEIELLRAGQLSRRLVQLRAIHDLLERDAPEDGRLAGFRESFAALAVAQRRDPAVVADLLGGPQAGAWAAACLRGLTQPDRPALLWTHLAHLGSVAAVAALRTGAECEVRVPVRSGAVFLPTLGRATVRTARPWALLRCAPGSSVLLDGSPPRDWAPVRLLGTDLGTVPLDDLDPYWSCFGLPVVRLTGEEVDRWRRQLDAACAILAERHHDRLATVVAAIRCLVPIRRTGRFGGMSASSGDAPGAVALTEQLGPDRLAATLLHEVQHFRLGALHDLAPLYRPRTDGLLHSPWRNDSRPLSGVLHGTYAFLGVADFWSREWPAAGRGAELMYARTVRQLRVGVEILRASTDLTPTGSALVPALDTEIGRLPVAGLAGDIRRLADDLVAHHRALWRLRQVEPDPAEVAALAEDWLRGGPLGPVAAPADRATTATAPGGDSPLFRLATAWVEHPDAVRSAAADPVTFDARYPGADPLDTLLLAGDYAEAQAGRLAEHAPEPSAWASLSVAHGRLCADPTRSPLATRPELVRAAWSRVTEATGPAPNPLARLASRYVAGTSTSDSMRR